MNRFKQKGAQIVEFALILPFFLMMLFLIVNFGFLLYDKEMVTNASREAVRTGVILTTAPWSSANIKQVACNYTKSALITVSSTTPNASCSTGPISITVKNCFADVTCATGTLNPATAPAFGEILEVKVSYTFNGFGLGTLLAVAANTNTPLTLVSSTKMNHE